MNLTLEAKSPDHFRAYAKSAGKRNPSLEERLALARDGKAFAKGAVVKIPVEDVAFEGPVTGDSFTLDAGETVVTRIAFFSSEKPVGEHENSDASGESGLVSVAVGEVAVNASGVITVALTEPAPSDVGVPEVAGLDLT